MRCGRSGLEILVRQPRRCSFPLERGGPRVILRQARAACTTSLLTEFSASRSECSRARSSAVIAGAIGRRRVSSHLEQRAGFRAFGVIKGIGGIRFPERKANTLLKGREPAGEKPAATFLAAGIQRSEIFNDRDRVVEGAARIRHALQVEVNAARHRQRPPGDVGQFYFGGQLRGFRRQRQG